MIRIAVMSFAAQACRAILRRLLLPTVLAVAVSQAIAAAGKPHIEGLSLGMSVADIKKASRRPCNFEPFSLEFPGMLCAVPGQPDVSMAVGLTRTKEPAQAFVLLLRFCSGRSFFDLVTEVQDRYRVPLNRRSAISDTSRGGSIGKDLVLALSQDGVCANGETGFDLLIGDPRVSATEKASLSAPSTIDQASDNH